MPDEYNTLVRALERWQRQQSEAVFTFYTEVDPDLTLRLKQLKAHHLGWLALSDMPHEAGHVPKPIRFHNAQFTTNKPRLAAALVMERPMVTCGAWLAQATAPEADAEARTPAGVRGRHVHNLV